MSSLFHFRISVSSLIIPKEYFLIYEFIYNIYNYCDQRYPFSEDLFHVAKETCQNVMTQSCPAFSQENLVYQSKQCDVVWLKKISRVLFLSGNLADLFQPLKKVIRFCLKQGKDFSKSACTSFATKCNKNCINLQANI